MNYYIASRLENVDQVRALKAILDEAGWEQTYDWTVHGSVQHDAARMTEVSAKEAEGVAEADVVIVLLAGGRGTHVELGIALNGAMMDRGIIDDWSMNIQQTRICIYSPDPERDFGLSGTTCAFYHHPLVERFTNWDAMVKSLLETNG